MEPRLQRCGVGVPAIQEDRHMMEPVQEDNLFLL